MTMKPRVRQFDDLGPLHQALLKACPPDHRTGVKSITVLARRLEMSAAGVYKWIERNRLPHWQAKRIVELHEEYANGIDDFNDADRVTLRDLEAFVHA